MVSRMSMLRRSMAVAATLLAGSGAALAQTDVEINAAVQFNFVSPGARSLALGGAFIGLADDATAAFTNPAGLTALSKPEISLEGRAFRYSHLFTSGGRLGGSPTRRGLDTVGELVNGESENDLAGLSFVSFVYPRGRWAVAAYRQEVANFEANIATQGSFLALPGGTSRIFPVVADMDLKIVNYGASAAVRFGEGFSIGAGVSLYDFSLTSTTRRFFINNTLPDNTPGSFYGPPLTTDANVINFQTQDSLPDAADHWKAAVNAGISWKIGEKFRLGAVFRQGPDFEFDVRHVFGARASRPGEVIAAKTATFHVPDAYGVGFSFRPTEALTLAVDYQRVQYSQLTKDFTTIFAGADPANYVADDANQLHVGVEYVFTGMTNPLAIRLGAWTDPEHKVRFIGPTTESDAAQFRAGDDEVHAAGGIGMVFGGRFQIDFAGDVSSRVKTASVSAVFRF